MRNVLTIARRELGTYFTTPWAWIVFTAMAFLSSIFFLGNLQAFKQVQDMAKAIPGGWARLPPDYAAFKNLTDGVIVPMWGAVTVITLFVAPFLSMGLFASEKKQKTFELLMTLPVRSSEIVLGKFLSGSVMVLATLGITIVYPLILAGYGASESGSALEWSTVLLGYAGVLLFGMACVAIGMFISSTTESQMISVVLTFAVSLIWFVIRFLGEGAEEPAHSIVSYVSFSTQLENLMKGVADLKTFIFFGSVMALMIFLTHRSVESNRWA